MFRYLKKKVNYTHLSAQGKEYEYAAQRTFRLNTVTNKIQIHKSFAVTPELDFYNAAEMIDLIKENTKDLDEAQIALTTLLTFDDENCDIRERIPEFRIKGWSDHLADNEVQALKNEEFLLSIVQD